MRSAYRILAIIIAVEVVIQAMAMVFAVAGLGIWVDEGGVLDKAAFESEDLNFTGVVGFMVHGINGMMIIPLLGLALLVVSFFAKVPGGVKWAAIVLGAIVRAGAPRHLRPRVGVHRGAARPQRLRPVRLGRLRSAARQDGRRGDADHRRRCVTEYVKAHLRQIVAIAATLVIVVPLAWMWQASRMPGSYSVMDMGYVDAGGGPVSATGHHGDHAGTISVSDLVEDTDRPADVVVELTARQGTVTLASGREVDGYTFNGTSPGPTIEATEGDLLEVRVHNEDVEDGISVHWHGVDVPNAEDGVAGVTQDAIARRRGPRLPVRRRRRRHATGTTRTRCRTSR